MTSGTVFCTLWKITFFFNFVTFLVNVWYINSKTKYIFGSNEAHRHTDSHTNLSHEALLETIREREILWISKRTSNTYFHNKEIRNLGENNLHSALTSRNLKSDLPFKIMHFHFHFILFYFTFFNFNVIVRYLYANF